jgi:hypothetical protein
MCEVFWLGLSMGILIPLILCSITQQNIPNALVETLFLSNPAEKELVLYPAFSAKDGREDSGGG